MADRVAAVLNDEKRLGVARRPIGLLRAFAVESLRAAKQSVRCKAVHPDRRIVPRLSFAKNTGRNLENYLAGLLPEVVEDTPKNRNIFFQSLLQTYIERDVILTGIRNLSDFRKFLTVLASRIGQEFQLNAVAAEVGVATQTAKQWLSIAESSGIIYLLPPFFENVGKTVIKRPKLFFTDTGFAAWLCKIPSPEALSKVYNNGSFFENFVVMELLKSWIHNGEEPYFYYYRDTRFNEIDLLIFDGTHYHPIEIKTSDSPQAGMIKAFDCIKGNTVKRGSGALICLTPKARYLSSDVVAHSIWDI